MSVKELCARLSVLLVMCAFALVAKATPTIEPIVGEDKGYKITINEPADFDIFNSSDNVFYTEEDGTEVKVSEVKELVIVTTGPHKLDRNKATDLMDNCTSLDILDLENCDVAGVTETGGANPFLGNGHPNPFKNRLKTLVFPKTAGMIIPASAFEGDTELETVIFPDREGNGTYEIMAYAFRNSAVKTVSLGKGYHITDFDSDQTSSGVSIFEHCTNLTNVVLDNSITQLGVKAFSATYNLKYLVLPEELINIGSLCFKECGIETVTIPDNVVLVKDAQIFQGCIYLKNVFVNSDHVVAPYQALMEENQTTNFKWKQGVTEQTYSTDDYTPQAIYNSSDDPNSPFRNKPYTIPILHYPGTNTGIENYRTPYYMQYQGVDPITGTTWPNEADFANIYAGIRPAWDAPEGDIGIPSFGADWVDNKNTQYSGWKQFYIGNNSFKEQKVFYDERIKESRWYSICLPINMTEAQFMNAYGVGAALHEFTGAFYDEENNTIVLKFDTPAQVEDGYLLKKNVPYMIHPAKIKFSKRKEVQVDSQNGGVEFVKETVEGQEQYATTEVIATFDVESDLFVNWDILLNGGQPFAEAIATVEENTTAALNTNAQTRRFTHERFPSVDFTFKGSYLGATIYGPADASGKQKQMGVAQDLPKGAYYLGYQSGMSQPKFFKAKGTTNGWSPYCALVEASNVSAGAKEFNVLDVDFNKTDVVVTKIGTPTIQIPVIKTDNKIYNLNGQVVRENSKDTNGLKGIYVVGGKKVVFN